MKDKPAVFRSQLPGRCLFALLFVLTGPGVAFAGTTPTITGTAQSPATATSGTPVWVTATVVSPDALGSVTLTYNAGTGPVTVPMYDDGAHQDFASGDGIYGAQIPSFASGKTVQYFITATTSVGLSATDPGIVPSCLYSYTVQSGVSTPAVNPVPGGSFSMGDHFNTVDPNHPSDEIPLHTVTVSTFAIGKFDVTNQQYCDYLNSALAQGLIHVTNGLVYGPDNSTVLSEISQGQAALYGITYSGIAWNGNTFLVLSGYKNMPAVGVRWEGALAYCNWLSALQGLQSCYSLTAWTCDFTKNGYRLPTEAEWEYAASGGNTNPYTMYSWGNDPNTDGSHANTLASGQPWATFTTMNQAGAVYPWATPVGFYNGELHAASAYNWPGGQTSYQAANTVNNYGLYDMAGNVWQWTNDWFAAGYYKVSPSVNPTGPLTGDLMPDGKQHHTLRGGSYAQGATDARITNRDPDFYRQPLNNTYASIGFRVVLAGGTSVQIATNPTLHINAVLANPTTFTATTDYPTQTLGVFSNTTSAYPGYTLIDPEHGRTTYLIDNTGQVVHSWTSSYVPGLASFVLPNGHLIRAGNLGSQAPVNTGGGEGGILEERDWNGNLVWSFKYAGTNSDGTGYEQHHDFVVMPNGNILMIVVEEKTNAAALAAGFNPSLFDTNLAAGKNIQVDSLVEVQPSGSGGGSVVWEWHIWDHLIQQYDPTKSNYGTVANHPELLNANGGQHTIQFFNHLNGIDYNAALDEILITCRNQCEIWIIDHSTTSAQAAGHTGGAHGKGGDFLYRWGNPSIYGAPGSEMMFQGHGAHWIPSGYPGAGDILFFNNGEQRPGGNYSSADEFTPPVDSSGAYPLSTGAAWGPSKLAWTWTATPPLTFYNSDGGSAVRLANGNTLIDYGNKGEVWEVNQAGQVVWDYQNPSYTGSVLYQGDSLPVDPNQSSGSQTCLWHAARYSSSYPAFSGRALIPSGTLEAYRGIVELYNAGSAAVDLSGMCLTSNLSTPAM